MNINLINKNEQERLESLILEESDGHNKACLSDDLSILQNTPDKYWMSFDLAVFQPGNIIETQRVNTISAMQNYYSK